MDNTTPQQNLTNTKPTASVPPQSPTSGQIIGKRRHFPMPKIIIAALVIGVILFAAFYASAYYLLNKQLDVLLHKNAIPTPAISQTPQITPTPSPDVPTNWQTYKNEEYFFSIAYPPNRVVQTLAAFGPPIRENLPPMTFSFLDKDRDLIPISYATEIHPKITLMVSLGGDEMGFQSLIDNIKKENQAKDAYSFFTIDGQRAIKRTGKDYLGKNTLTVYTTNGNELYEFNVKEDDFPVFETMISNFQFLSRTPSPSSSQTACSQEAKQCPDGSYVGRTGPNCEFSACPQ